MKQSEFDRILFEKDYEALAELLRKSPGKTRLLVSKLYESNKSKLDIILKTFQVVSKILDEDRLADLVRRLMWLLNEESGNSCPSAALAIGHIAHVRYDIVAPHVPVLRVYAEDPSTQMRTAARHSLAMIKIASMSAGK